MIYLEETLNLYPATVDNIEAYIEYAGEHLVPASQRLGARFIAAWYSSIEWFYQVTNVLEFDDMEALKAFRIKSCQDSEWGEYSARLEEFAPERRSRLLEPLGPITPETLHQAITESQQTPVGNYLLAILEVERDRMSQFISGLESGAQNLPIIASWRPLAGSPNEVIDVWKSSPVPETYQPANDWFRQFIRQVREVAPRERVIRVLTLPYSPLR
jgi:hypothetical protein